MEADEPLEIAPDAAAWDEWLLGVNSAGAPCSLFLNHNTREALWQRPPEPVLPSTPAAVPSVSGEPLRLREGAREMCGGWHLPAPRLASHEGGLMYLDELPHSRRFASHIRRRYPLGLGGLLGVGDLPVSVLGERWPHAIAMHARGGLSEAKVDCEAVMATWDLSGSSADVRERFMRFASSVALDDSSAPGTASPVIFSVLLDAKVLWRSRPIFCPGEVDLCNVPVAGGERLQLIVETDHSGSARAVWVDPHLLLEPLPLSVVHQVTRLPDPEVKPRLQFALSRDGSMLRLLPATESCEEPCTYAVFLFVANNKAADGLRAGEVLISIDGQRELPPEVIRGSSPWLSAFDGVVLSAGMRAPALLETADVGELSWLRLRCSRKVAAVIAAIDVVNSATGEVASFIPPAGLSENTSAGRSPTECEIAMSREPRDSGVYRVTLHCERDGGLPADVELELHGARSEPDAMHGETRLELADSAIWAGRLHEHSGAASALVGGAAGPMDALFGLSVKLSRDLQPKGKGLIADACGGFSRPGELHIRSAEVVHLGTAKALFFDFPKGDSRTCYHVRPSPGPIQRVAVTTSKERWAGTDAVVTLSLYGRSGRLLDQELSGKKQAMDAGRTDVFFMEAPSLGELHKLSVSHDGSGFGADWRPEMFEVTDMSHGRTFVIPCTEWIREGSTAELYAPGREHHDDQSQYHIVLWTESQAGSLLDAAEAAEVLGADGRRTGLFDLERGRVDWDADDSYLSAVRATAAARRGPDAPLGKTVYRPAPRPPSGPAGARRHPARGLCVRRPRRPLRGQPRARRRTRSLCGRRVRRRVPVPRRSCGRAAAGRRGVHRAVGPAAAGAPRFRGPWSARAGWCGEGPPTPLPQRGLLARAAAGGFGQSRRRLRPGAPSARRLWGRHSFWGRRRSRVWPPATT
uniref:Lipoxygenase homology domain-containing protein 1 isoform x1 n=1 Tax=Tetraselmis sp. GSL018 TaxID=582737 RepID=A0A061RZ32_9CHLO